MATEPTTSATLNLILEKLEEATESIAVLNQRTEQLAYHQEKTQRRLKRVINLWEEERAKNQELDALTTRQTEKITHLRGKLGVCWDRLDTLIWMRRHCACGFEEPPEDDDGKEESESGEGGEQGGAAGATGQGSQDAANDEERVVDRKRGRIELEEEIKVKVEQGPRAELWGYESRLNGEVEDEAMEEDGNEARRNEEE